MYFVKWWNAYGECRISEKMTLQEASMFAQTMNPDQDATIFYVTR